MWHVCGRGAYSVSVGDLRKREYLQTLVLNAMIILKGIFKEWDGDFFSGSV
jgi:hypothetical protein